MKLLPLLFLVALPGCSSCDFPQSSAPGTASQGPSTFIYTPRWEPGAFGAPEREAKAKAEDENAQRAQWLFNKDQPRVVDDTPEGQGVRMRFN